MKRMLLGAAGLMIVAGVVGAQAQEEKGGVQSGPGGTNLSTGGVTVPLPRVEIVPTTGGLVGATIVSPPPAGTEDRPGVSGMTGTELRRDLGREGQGSPTEGTAASAGARSSGSSGSLRSSGSGAGPSDASAGLGGGGGGIDEQRGAARQQLRNTSGAGITASEGQRPNRVAGDRLDARQGRVGAETSGSVTGTNSPVGAGAGSGTGLGSLGGSGGSLGGARAGGSRGGASGGRGGSGGGGSSGGGGGG